MASCRPGRRLASLYLITQGLIGGIWWALLLTLPAARERFQPEGYPPGYILTYFLPDMLLFVAGSSLAARMVLRAGASGVASLWCVTGATTYAALHCVGISLATGGFAHAAVMMSVAAACTCTLAATIGSNPDLLPSFPFRESVRREGRVGRLIVQITVFWVVLLLLIPFGLDWVEHRLRLPPLAGAERWMPAIRAAGWGIFLTASVLNLWVSAVMLRAGDGTPLPSECASRLVTTGPYSVVRNPMAVAAVAQGVGVAMILGSWLTLGYMAIGAAYWHLAVRPAEEADLLRRFGEPYEDYRSKVRCWLPKRRSGALSGDR